MSFSRFSLSSGDVIQTVKQAVSIAGRVQDGNSKILGSTWSLPPTACKVGAKLIKVEGSTCSKCYDMKSYRMYPSVRKGRDNNLTLWDNAETNGRDAIADLATALAFQIDKISKKKQKKGEAGAMLHRWFTGGDLQSVAMLEAFAYVAKLLPHINFWLPTREKAIVNKFYAKTLDIPSNLVIRVSAAMIDGQATAHQNTSTVHKDGDAIGYDCPAYKQGGNCGDCTACWNSEVKNVSYKAH